MKELDYGKGYQYAHDSKDKLTNMQCLPDSLSGKEYYYPTEEGAEERFKTRLEEIKKWKQQQLPAIKALQKYKLYLHVLAICKVLYE